MTIALLIVSSLLILSTAALWYIVVIVVSKLDQVDKLQQSIIQKLKGYEDIMEALK